MATNNYNNEQESIYNELLPLDIRFLKERNFVEYNWDYRKPLPL